MAVLDGIDVSVDAQNSNQICAEPDVDTQVGDRLRVRRMTIGMTQAQLARVCGISAQQIHKYEIGVSRMTSGRLHQFAQVLDVPISWFFGETTEPGSETDVCFHMLNDQYNLEILKAAHSIQNNKRKARLVKIAQLFAEEE
ncbi:MAG: helix-turn-helix transcriptional regulator [Pseudomonadota bacterium]